MRSTNLTVGENSRKLLHAVASSHDRFPLYVTAHCSHAHVPVLHFLVFKRRFWEGGVRTVAFVSWKGLPASVKGTKLKGLAHLTDWYITIVEGIAGVNASDGGPAPLDGHNLWPALTGLASASPRTDVGEVACLGLVLGIMLMLTRLLRAVSQVVHMPSSNKYNNASICRKGPGHGCSPAIRIGDLKLIVGWPGSDSLWTWDPLQHKSTPFGLEGGTCVNKTKCTAPHWKQMNPQKHQSSTCVPYCLFNVSQGADLGEHKDLATEPAYKEHIQAMLKRLEEEARTGIPLAYIPGAEKKSVADAQCSLYHQTGFWLPADMPGYTPGPPGPAPPPSPPSPPPKRCETALETTCPVVKGEGFSACRECCREHVSTLGKEGAGCHPRDYTYYCNHTTATAY